MFIFRWLFSLPLWYMKFAAFMIGWLGAGAGAALFWVLLTVKVFIPLTIMSIIFMGFLKFDDFVERNIGGRIFTDAIAMNDELVRNGVRLAVEWTGGNSGTWARPSGEVFFTGTLTNDSPMNLRDVRVSCKLEKAGWFAGDGDYSFSVTTIKGPINPGQMSHFKSEHRVTELQFRGRPMCTISGRILSGRVIPKATS